MASFTVPCPNSALLNGSQLQQPLFQQSKISFQSKSTANASFLAGSSSLDLKPGLFRSQGASHVKSTIWKVQAQLNEVADKTTNSAPVPKGKLEVSSAGEEVPEEEKPAAAKRVPDASAIAAFMSQVSDLVKLVDSRDISELQLKQLDCELTIRKKEALPQPPSQAPVYMMQPPQQQAYQSQPPPAPAQASAPASASPAAAPLALPAPAKSSHPPLKCPMAGTFYRCPGPGEPPFVKVGDKVQKGQIVCIVEAMKLMNEIEADRSGTVLEVLLEDGKPVSVDTPLFVIAP